MNNFYVYRYSDQNDIPFYIGKGSGRRFRVSIHLSGSNPFLRNKIKKVGADNVKVSFLRKNLIEKEAFVFETHYIKFYGRRNLGEGTLCNLTNGGEGNSGYVCSTETRQKISEARKGENNPMYGKCFSEEHKRKLSEARKGENNPMYGKHISEKTRQKMSKAHKGKMLSEEHKRKLSESNKGENNHMFGKRGKDNPNYGRKHTEESKRKLSEARKGENNPMYGRTHTKKARQKISKRMKGENHPMYGIHRKGKDAPMYGKKHSEETKRKMSVAIKLYWAKKKKNISIA